MKKYFHYFIVLLIIGILLLILMEAVLMPIYVRSGNIQKLIDVQNLHLQVALTRLDSDGFRGVVVDTALTNDAIPNTIISQYPKPYSFVKAGRTVKLKVTQPEKMVSVPNLIGHSLIL